MTSTKAAPRGVDEFACSVQVPVNPEPTDLQITGMCGRPSAMQYRRCGWGLAPFPFVLAALRVPVSGARGALRQREAPPKVPCGRRRDVDAQRAEGMIDRELSRSVPGRRDPFRRRPEQGLAEWPTDRAAGFT